MAPDARAASRSEAVMSMVTMKAGLALHSHRLSSSSSGRWSDDRPCFAFFGPSLHQPM